jgi:hypothetical protein
VRGREEGRQGFKLPPLKYPWEFKQPRV